VNSERTMVVPQRQIVTELKAGFSKGWAYLTGFVSKECEFVFKKVNSERTMAVPVTL
jgi:hypothetical protein